MSLPELQEPQRVSVAFRSLLSHLVRKMVYLTPLGAGSTE